MRRSLFAAGLITALGLLAGCDGSDEDGAGPASAPSASQFPSANGKTLAQVEAEATQTDELVVSPAGQIFRPGKNRLGFGVFTAGRDEVKDATVAIYAARGPNATARGPFPAQATSLETDAAYRSEGTAADPLSAGVVYVTEISLPAKGEWRLTAVIERDGEHLFSRMPSLIVDDHPAIPASGEEAIKVSTPTRKDVGGDLSQIDTRNPPSTQHEDDLADVLGERPVVLLFATPALCQSRVCGPVVDIAEQVKDETSDEVAFIHMEIFKNNRPDAGVRPQVSAYGLQTEPWLFVIDADGRVDTVIEGAFSADELRAAVESVS